LERSRLAAEQVVLLHHPILLAAPEVMPLVAAAIDKVGRHARRASRDSIPNKAP
jgi:hypothetical protein